MNNDSHPGHEQIMINPETKAMLDYIKELLRDQWQQTHGKAARRKVKPSYDNAVRHLFERLDATARKLGASGGSEEIIGFVQLESQYAR